MIAVAKVQPFGDDQLTRLFTVALRAMECDVEFEDLRTREPADEDDEGPSVEEMQENIRSVFGV